MKIFKKLFAKHWPLFIVIGYLLGIILEPALLSLGVESLEIHWRLLLIFFLSALSFGGLLLTMLPWPYVVIALAALNIFFYLKKRK